MMIKKIYGDGSIEIVDTKLNYLKSCSECHEEDYEYYQELWADYWARRL